MKRAEKLNLLHGFQDKPLVSPWLSVIFTMVLLAGCGIPTFPLVGSVVANDSPAPAIGQSQISIVLDDTVAGDVTFFEIYYRIEVGIGTTEVNSDALSAARDRVIAATAGSFQNLSSVLNPLGYYNIRFIDAGEGRKSFLLGSQSEFSAIFSGDAVVLTPIGSDESIDLVGDRVYSNLAEDQYRILNGSQLAVDMLDSLEGASQLSDIPLDMRHLFSDNPDFSARSLELENALGNRNGSYLGIDIFTVAVLDNRGQSIYSSPTSQNWPSQPIDYSEIE